MGLDFSHCDAHWAYSGFHRFRTKLAKEIGVNLEEMEGFTENGKPWSSLAPDPIHDLLFHSDCEGELSPEQCRKIAPRLRELVSRWEDLPVQFDRQQALLLAQGMEDAAKAGEPLRFT